MMCTASSSITADKQMPAQVLGDPDWQLMRDLTSLETQDLLSRYQSKLISKHRQSQASMSTPTAADMYSRMD